MPHLYLDLDGVFADFEKHVDRCIGKPCKSIRDEEMWAAIREIPNFYLGCDLMPEAPQMWAAFRRLKPTFLTGIPRLERSMVTAAEDKAAWARKRFENSPVICCLSKEKAKHCKPGDILLDDRPDYANLWLAAGGHFVLHVPEMVDHSISIVLALYESEQIGVGSK